MDATFNGHVFGLANQFVAGFDVNHIEFTHTNNSPYGGASSVNPYVFDPGSFFATTSPTTPGFNSIVNQYALFAEDRLSLTDQLSLVTGVRYDRPDIDRTDYRTPGNSFRCLAIGHQLAHRAGLRADQEPRVLRPVCGRRRSSHQSDLADDIAENLPARDRQADGGRGQAVVPGRTRRVDARGLVRSSRPD